MRFLVRHLCYAAIALSLLAMSACADGPRVLEVELVTGLAPGAEFRIVETTVTRGDAQSAERVETAEAIARAGVSYGRGRRVAGFALTDGDYRVRVRLLRPDGSFLVDRVMALSFVGDTVLRVHVTRDCVGVTCPSPGGAEAFSTCLAGRCVDPRCSMAAPEFCPDVSFCDAASECATTSECAMPACDEGVCIPVDGERPCARDFFCNPDPGAGCQPLMPNPESSFPCGTICTMPSAPCEFGYWSCSDPETPVCSQLQYRPVGFVCAADRTCDAVGNCVAEAREGTVIVTPTGGLVTNENGAVGATVQLVLSSAPTADVTISVTSSNLAEATVGVASVTFTASNWSLAQSIMVSGVDDDRDDGDQAFAIVLGDAVSADPVYNAYDVPDVNGTNVDDDSAAVNVAPVDGLVTSEAGGTASFDVVLATRPTALVEVMIVSSDAGEGIASPTLLTFDESNWNVPHTVLLTGVDDAISDGTQSYSVVVGPASSLDPAYTVLPSTSVLVMNTDNDMPGITVSPIAGLVTDESGVSDTFSVVLNTAPSANVVLSLTSSDLSEGNVSENSATFTTSNWSTPQIFTVTGVDDPFADGDQSYSIFVEVTSSADSAYSSLDVDDVALTNEDDDEASVVVFSAGGLTTNELGGVAVFNMSLGAQPTSDVTVALSVDDASEGSVSPALLTFTSSNWDSLQAVTVTGRDDVAIDGDITYHVITAAAVSADAAYNGLAVDDVSVLNQDNEINVVQDVYVKASNTEAGDFFGEAVTLSGDGNTLVVGAARENGGVAGIDGNEADNSVLTSGAVYVYLRSGSVWAKQAYVKSSNPDVADVFGSVLAVSHDGNTLVVAAPNESSNATGVGGAQGNNSSSLSGAVYVFVRSGSVWSQQAYIKASNTGSSDNFGSALALTPDGNTLVVGAHGEDSNATGIGGDQANNSVQDAGAVYVFSRAGTVWTQDAYIKASNTGMYDSFSDSLAISNDGLTLAISAFNERSNATGIGGNEADNSLVASGAVYIFVRSGPSWGQQAYIKASNTDAADLFGFSISLTGDGNLLAVGARGESSNATGINGNQLDDSTQSSGAVYIFSRAGSVWSQNAYIKSWKVGAYQNFGECVDLSDDGTRLAVGASGDQSGVGGVGGDPFSTSRPGSGAVYVFSNSGAVWMQTSYIKASNPGTSDQFGAPNSVSMSADGHTLAVGAVAEQSGATGLGGSEADDSANNAGAVYVFNAM